MRARCATEGACPGCGATMSMYQVSPGIMFAELRHDDDCLAIAAETVAWLDGAR